MPEYLFITGRLAAPALTAVLAAMRPDFDYEIAALDANVAALMDTRFIASRLTDARGCARVMLPGLCRGDLGVLEDALGTPVVRGPADLKDLPAHFGGRRDLSGYGPYRTKILAEIHDAHELSLDAVLTRARYYRDCGADYIDLGGPAAGGMPGVEDMVAALKAQGYGVSVDSFDPETIIRADRAGADLILSVNASNIEAARGLRAAVVVIPDFGEGLESLERNAQTLRRFGTSHILDPILDPVGFGLSDALWRYRELRRRRPDDPMLMGLGNVTELTEADSVGITALLAGVMAELSVDYALTTEVASWARGAVRELDLARRLMRYAVEERILPKGVDDRLLTVKERAHPSYSTRELRELQAGIDDANFRIFVGEDGVTAFNQDLFVQGTRPEDIFPRLGVDDPSHAFYLGRELERAFQALTLGKRYIQEQPLDFGYISRDRAREAQSPLPSRENKPARAANRNAKRNAKDASQPGRSDLPEPPEQPEPSEPHGPMRCAKRG